MQNRLKRLQEMRTALAVRRGLVTLIPILMIGSFSLVLRSLQIPAYQYFITQWADSTLYTLFSVVYDATFGLLAVYMAGAIGYHYGILVEDLSQNTQFGTLLISLACFSILSGTTADFLEPFGPKGMFVAILAAVLGSFLFVHVSAKMRPVLLFSDGADVLLSNAVRIIPPAAITLLVFALGNWLILTISHAESFYQLVMNGATSLLTISEANIFNGILFVVASSVLWFLGIHGTNVFEGAVNQVFVPATSLNIALVAAGEAPTEILTKPFFDIFVLPGGCGATLGLLVALLLFSQRRSTRHLTKVALVPMLFNINEIMVFGLPIIYNPTFLIPFLSAPLVCFATSYLAMWTGLVPLVTQTVEWTTPVFFSGYIATGSVAGILLQVVNLMICVFIYRPFVKRYDEEKLGSARKDYETLVKRMQESETSRVPLYLTGITATYGWMAKALASDLAQAREKGEMVLHYQPQYHLDGRCIGAEALLRWQHPLLGVIYPPLVFQLATETGLLADLEEWVVRQAAQDAGRLQGRWRGRVSVNVTGVTMQTQRFEGFLSELAKERGELTDQLCIELTEQAAFQLNDVVSERFQHIRQAGYHLAVDDFSMGSTSLHYLLGGHFDLVKLDGSLVREIGENPRCRDIVSSIVQLSNTLGVAVLAEYVETRALRDELAQVGCVQYQGWYYAKAMPFSEFKTMLEA